MAREWKLTDQRKFSFNYQKVLGSTTLKPEEAKDPPVVHCELERETIQLPSWRGALECHLNNSVSLIHKAAEGF